MKYTITQSRLLYVMSIDDRKHRGLLKVGEVFVDNSIAASPDKQRLAGAVREILDKRNYMQSVVGNYALELVECTKYAENSCYKAEEVHLTLKGMGIEPKFLNTYKPAISVKGMGKQPADVWFQCSLADILKALGKIKAGQGVKYGKIEFRPEQLDAIEKTVNYFTKECKDDNKARSFLWNAKMRFGKTLCGLEVARRCGFRSTLIITHRPVVDKGWHEDFQKIFGNLPEYEYATRMKDDNQSKGDFYQLTKAVDEGRKRLVFFVSMQYLRLSQYVGGKERRFDKLKRSIMEYDWDFVMVDEAHEGIEAAAGVRVMEKLEKMRTRKLSLSGTPFNLLDKYKENEIYTWDYVMEQRAKLEWDDTHFGDPNPYADLPRMQILTFTLPKMVREEKIKDNEVFRFHEFFRVWTAEEKAKLQDAIDKEQNTVSKAEMKARLEGAVNGAFMHEGAVRAFVKKLHERSDTSQYPFSTKEFRDNFRHTFWIVPGVKEAAALEKLLREDEVFGQHFHIINAAGDGNIEDEDGSALTEVLNNIRGNEKLNISSKSRTITLSCGKLTTGVSVPEWTAVLCMKGSENTPAANYMQTIFRVQTHAVLRGCQKSDCYVFDFAPDRALTAVAETAKMAVYALTEGGKKQLKLTKRKEEEHLAAFIKLCPLLSMDEGEMGRHFTAGQIFEKLSNVYIERAVRSGYSDNSLYQPEQLMNLTAEQEKVLGDVHHLLGSMPSTWKPEPITLNKNGLGDLKDVDDVKYVYFLSATNTVPPCPVMAGERDVDGRPVSTSDGWNDEMTAPSPMFPYLFVSNSRLINGEWTAFSNPVIWKQWEKKDDEKDEDKKKRDAENKEKRARMSVLRGVSIRIPLLVYGAEINDDAGEEITIDNFASEEIVDQASWEEFMPKGFTKEMFNVLKDCFDRSIFTGAAKRIRAMVKEADNLNTEDRIARIATIFSYFHNPDKETVLTPWRVVNMQLSDCLGGWCFFNKEFDAPYTVENENQEHVNAGRFVDRGEVTRRVFYDYNARILEINSKTGLYPLYMTYSIFKGAKEPAFRAMRLTGQRGGSSNAEQYHSQANNDLEIWKDVLQDNIFVVCRTPMAVSITKRTLAGFRKDIRMNIRCYEREVDGKKLDMIDVLRFHADLFRIDIIRGNDFWHVYQSIPKAKNEDINNMKFTAIVGNPPYQVMDGGGTGSSAIPIYNKFFEAAKLLKPKNVTMIIPAKWYTGGKGLDEFRETMLNDKQVSKLFDFQDSRDCFPTVDIAGGVCYLLWEAGNNSPCQVTNINKGDRISSERYLNEYDTFIRNEKVLDIINRVKAQTSIGFLSQKVYVSKPFGIRSFQNGFPTPALPGRYIQLFGSTGITYLEEKDVPQNKQLLPLWKVIMSKASAEHAGQTDANGRKRIVSRLEVLGPNMICTESYLLLDTFENEQEAINLKNYMKTQFVRFLLSSILITQNIVRDKFRFVPLQNFTCMSDIDWSKPIGNIDQQLYQKYSLTKEDIDFIESVIKPMD